MSYEYAEHKLTLEGEKYRLVLWGSMKHREDTRRSEYFDYIVDRYDIRGEGRVEWKNKEKEVCFLFTTRDCNPTDKLEGIIFSTDDQWQGYMLEEDEFIEGKKPLLYDLISWRVIDQCERSRGVPRIGFSLLKRSELEVQGIIYQRDGQAQLPLEGLS